MRSGFSQWFPAATQAQAPAWKMNMIVLLLLYPVVFLFGLSVQTPILMHALGLPFWLALFLGNVVSVLILNYLVPWTSRRFAWWLTPAETPSARIDLTGAGLILAGYIVLLAVFSRM